MDPQSPHGPAPETWQEQPPASPFSNSTTLPYSAEAPQAYPAAPQAYQQPPSAYPGMPPVYPPAPMYPYYQEDPAKGIATAALVLGIVSTVFSWSALLGLALSITGLCLSVKARKETIQHTGMATAGMVLSIISLVSSGFITLACLAVM